MVISTLEALAILISLKLRFGDAPDSDDTKVLIAPSITDNRGNGAVLNKLMTTRFPSSALLMEMGSYMKARGMRAIVEWAPREFNKEADQLANGITDSFDPRVVADTHLEYPSDGDSGRTRCRASLSRHEGTLRTSE